MRTNPEAIYSVEQKIDALDREIKFRRLVYANKVANRAMSQQDADFQINIMVEMKLDYESLLPKQLNLEL